MTDPNANILSLTLPTDLLTGGGGGGGGLSLNYNLGPNAASSAAAAYDFLGQQFSGAQAFESKSIAGTQDFMAQATQPIIQAVAGQSDSYFTQLLNAFNLTTNAQTQLGTAAVNAQSQATQASISASQNAQGGGSLFSSIFGGCFITTAVCKYSHLPDDCELLQIMRAWRDGWMQETDTRRALVASYYQNAPGYVAHISAMRENAQRIIWRELKRLISYCAVAIQQGQNPLALAYYMAAVEFARVSSESAA